MFCPNCGSILMPKKIEGRMHLRCDCGYSSSDIEKAKIREPVKKASEERRLEPAFENKIAAPITDDECPKCQNDKAYYWTRQTRAGDEAETKFLQCTRCRHKWRDYG